MMTCCRCQGLMVEDHLLDLEDTYGGLWIRGWRCLCCGDVVDPVISRHRVMQQNARALGTTLVLVEEEEAAQETEAQQFSLTI